MNQARLNLRAMPRQIASRLAQLRRRLTTWVLVKGVGRWLLLVLAVLAFDILLDRMFKMDFAQRAIMLVVMGLLVIGLFFWRVIKPLSNRISDDALLHEIESKYPQLKENLITGAQLARLDDLEAKGVSKELADVTIDRSLELAEEMDFSETINQKKFAKNCGLLGLGAVLLALLAVGVLQTQFLSTWFNRNILLGSAQWPQATYLNVVGVEDGVLVLPRGADHRLMVHVTEESRVRDVEVSVEIDNANGQAIHQMKQTGKLDGREHLFVMHNVSSEMKFRVSGGDDVSEPISVRLVEPPAIMSLDMWAVLPEYTRMPNLKLEGPGPHSVVAGSRIEGKAIVNKALGQFSVAQDQTVYSLTQADKDLHYQLQIPKAGEVLVGGQYEFQLVDDTGLAAIRPIKFALSIKEDASPKVLASLLGISGLAVNRARLPVSYNVKDEFGLSTIDFETNWKNSDSAEENAGTVGERRVAIASFIGEPNAVRDKQDVAVLELESFGFEPGTSFRMLVRAADSKPGEANSSDSAEFLIRIVSEEELRADLLRREIEQRKAFQQAYDAQLELMAELQAATASDSGSSENEQQKRMIALSREQKLVGTNLDGIANRFEEFLVEAQNNRLDEEEADLIGDQSMIERFDKQIIKPIRALDRDLISTAVRELDNCRRLMNEREKLDRAVDEATALHQQILDEMKRIASAMQDSESYQELVNKLLEIKRAEERIKVGIKKRKPDEKDVFDEDEIFDDN